MKSRYKLRALGDVQAVVDAAPTLQHAADALGVNRSTLTRWMQTGKVQRPAKFAATGETVTLPPEVEAGTWAEQVKAGHALSASDLVLVELADAALQGARLLSEPLPVRLAATARFAAVVRQLNLEAKVIGDAAKKPEPSRLASVTPFRRASGDPRAVLMAAK